MRKPEREEQTIGRAAAEPPGRQRAEAKGEEPVPDEESLYADVPGQSQEPEGEGS